MSSTTHKPNVLILHASGTNRDAEAARACALAGGKPEIVHINQLRAGERSFATYDTLLLPGGFSYGDALGAGARMALDMQVFFQEELHTFVESGKPVLGICNGFQVLVKAGLLPGNNNGNGNSRNSHSTSPSTGSGRSSGEAQHATAIRQAQASRNSTLTQNGSGHFECRWVHLAVNPQARAGWLAGIEELIFCPVAHGEGNFQVADDATLTHLEAENLVAFRYVDGEGNPVDGRYPLNPNGSVADIAGICNARGNVVGLMPHPEDHILPIQNPIGGAGQLGLALFQALLQAA